MSDLRRRVTQLEAAVWPPSPVDVDMTLVVSPEEAQKCVDEAPSHYFVIFSATGSSSDDPVWAAAREMVRLRPNSPEWNHRRDRLLEISSGDLSHVEGPILRPEQLVTGARIQYLLLLEYYRQVKAGHLPFMYGDHGQPKSPTTGQTGQTGQTDEDRRNPTSSSHIAP